MYEIIFEYIFTEGVGTIDVECRRSVNAHICENKLEISRLM